MEHNGQGAVIVNHAKSAIVTRGLERIEAWSPAAVDILHHRHLDDPSIKNYSWVVELTDVSSMDTEPADRTAELDADAWTIRVNGSTPAQVSVRAGTERAQLYALYHIAECLATGKPPAEWPVERRPRVPKRYAWPSAGNVWSPVFRPDQYKQVIEELPGLGINGVLITCTTTHGTHYGRDTIPFDLTDDGVVVDHHKLPVFRALFDELKSYGLDIHLLHQAFTPPTFTSEDASSNCSTGLTGRGSSTALP